MKCLKLSNTDFKNWYPGGLMSTVTSRYIEYLSYVEVY